MEGLIGLAIQLVSGAVGGNIAGGLFKNFSLGTLGNSIAGIIGGGLGGQLLGMLGIGGAEAAGSLDLTGILTTVAGGGVGVLLAVVGLFKKLFSNSLSAGGLENPPSESDPTRAAADSLGVFGK